MPEILRVYLTAVSGLKIDLHLPEFPWGIFAGNQNLPELMAKKLDDGWPESEERCSEICKSEDGKA